jgi:NAD(P)-dependent dehydrogenase (short-subunit alcohol dehydrogenase family)
MPKKAETVVVTGASAGVGRAIAERFGRAGANVALLARGRDGLEAAARQIEADGGRALIIPLDVSDAAAVDAAAAQVERELGPIDIWVNNAMLSVFSPVHEMTAEEFRRVTEVTYLGYVHGTLAAYRRMRERDRGMIVQIGSALSYRSIPLQSAYCAAKHAVVGFTDSLRCELHHDNSSVKVTVVHLPAVNTPQFSWVKSRLPNKPQPVPPIYQPEVIADGVYYAAHASRREFWIGLPTVQAIIGQRLIPGLLDLYLGKTGYASQQTEEPVSRDRRDNLWAPLPGDHGAHGDFDHRAMNFSLQMWLNKNRGWLAAAAGVALAVGAAWLGNREDDAEDFPELHRAA